MTRTSEMHRPLSAAYGLLLLTAGACLLSTGCNGPGGSPRFNAQDKIGRTYYIDGAGNWGFGVSDVQNGLRRAGYHGNIINYGWSPFFNPAMDQTIGRPAARAKGEQLGREITQYLEHFPQNQVSIISLSAGTGVGVWACENVKPPAKVYSLILLGSSLSSRYDMRKSLANISGGVWVYHSPNDLVLQGPVRTLGTIDGELAVDSAGLVGLRGPAGGSGKIHNVPWSSRYEQYGWTGAHTDSTSEPFVRAVLAKHIVLQGATDEPKTSDTGGPRQRDWYRPPKAGEYNPLAQR